MFHAHRKMIPVISRNGHGSGAHGLSHPATHRPPASVAPPAENQVVFQTVEGGTQCGRLRHLNRHTVIWELSDPAGDPRLSEALGNFKIIVQARTVYAGQAVISHLVSAGAKTICTATLAETGWVRLDFTTLPAPGLVAQEFKNFLGDWQKLYKVTAAFKVVIADMQTFLTDLRCWLESVEAGIPTTPARRQASVAPIVAGELGALTLPVLTNFFEEFERVLGKVEPELLPAHQAFARRQLHPLLLCSPFLHRCFTKPLGYAGDYEMVNMMLREPLEGASLYAKIINHWFVRQPPAEAHRNRIQRLIREIQAATLRTDDQRRTAKILSIGCGPAHEVQQFLRESHLADRAEFTLLDFNAETLAHCQAAVTGAASQFHRRTTFKFVKKSVQQIIKEAGRHAAPPAYDLIYCAGLFDYLNDAVCLRLTEVFYAWLAPGGRLVTTNVDVSNPRRLSMGPIMAWHLFHRSSTELMALKPTAAPVDWCRVQSDPTGVNIYFEAHKPERE